MSGYYGMYVDWFESQEAWLHCVIFATYTTLPNTLLHNKLSKSAKHLNSTVTHCILIFTKDLEKHCEVTKAVLEILRANDLYLKPEKCEFEKTCIEYLGLIISENHVEMDPVKVKGIMDWPVPKKVKDVQAFIGFCNFYQRFIEGFSWIARPLSQLTRKDVEWAWTSEAQDAFDELKRKFTTAPLLVMPDPGKKLRVETDASDFAWGAILSQLEDDGIYHPVAYISKALTEAERNDDVHDKELKGVVGSLEQWRQYLEGAKHTVEIWTDHRNLECFKTGQKLSCRQARWLQFLQRFDYVLIHKPGALNKADGLSRRIDHKEGVEHDNENQIVLTLDKFLRQPTVGRGSTSENPVISRRIRVRTAEAVELLGDQELKEQIEKCTEMDDKVIMALKTIKENGPRLLNKGLQEWNFEDNLIIFRGKIYVPKDESIRTEVVRSCHDPVIMGHPGRFKTLEMVQHNFWWPGMSNFVKDFVDGCLVCQETKNITHPTRVPLQPTEIPERPFQYITIDFIVKLPESEGQDSILMVTDQSTKAIVIIPCIEKIDADQTAELLIKQVFCKYSVPKKIISDRGPQFASKVMKAVLESMQVKSALTTAYHPQADGATEHVNQEVEQYLWAYCNQTQNNWVSLLPYAEMTHNTRIHSATRKSPFELLFGYQPRWPGKMIPSTRIPAAEQRIEELQKAREEAEASVKIAQEAMKIQHGRHGIDGPTWKEGDKVWLEGKNLKTQLPSVKLGPKRFGPFEITRKIGQTSLQLKLPKTWKIHNVFHASLLLPYKETTAHGPNFTIPPPDIVEGEEQWEVEEIVNVRQFGKRKTWQYFVKWKGYPDSENTWEPLSHLSKSGELLEEWHNKNPKKKCPKTLPIVLARLQPHVLKALKTLVTWELMTCKLNSR
jgi:hypothetical protein